MSRDIGSLLIWNRKLEEINRQKHEEMIKKREKKKEEERKRQEVKEYSIYGNNDYLLPFLGGEQELASESGGVL